MLSCIYPHIELPADCMDIDINLYEAVTLDKIEKLLEIGHQYEIWELIKGCERYLMHPNCPLFEVSYHIRNA